MEHRSISRARPGLWVVLALVFASRTGASPLRSPQIVFDMTALQSLLNSEGESINVSTQQIVNDPWIQTLLTKCDATISVAELDTTLAIEFGAYSTASATPVLEPLIAAGARPGWYTALHVFPNGKLGVVSFDAQGAFVSLVNYEGFDTAHLGFYIKSPKGTWYSEDARNGGNAQALSFDGDGRDFGEYFLCFETSPYAYASSTFTGMILEAEPVCGDPAQKSTWGAVKTRY